MPRCLLLLLLSLSVLRADEVATLESLVGEWVALRRAQSEEAAAWKVESSRLQTELDLLSRAESQLTSERDDLLAVSSSADQARADASAEVQAHQQALTSLTDILDQSEQALRDRWERLPAPLTAPLQEDLDALENAGDPLRRLRAVYVLQERMLVLENSLTPLRLILDLDGGRREMDTLWIGTAVVYGVTPDDTLALRGIPTSDGIRWEPLPGQADRVRQALRIAAGEAAPSLISLPLPEVPE